MLKSAGLTLQLSERTGLSVVVVVVKVKVKVVVVVVVICVKKPVLSLSILLSSPY